MLVRMQFVVKIHSPVYAGTALAWPSDRHGHMHLTHEPLESIGYGSEAVAIADLDRWLDKFPTIESAEYIVYGDNHVAGL